MKTNLKLVHISSIATKKSERLIVGEIHRASQHAAHRQHVDPHDSRGVLRSRADRGALAERSSVAGASSPRHRPAPLAPSSGIPASPQGVWFPSRDDRAKPA